MEVNFEKFQEACLAGDEAKVEELFSDDYMETGDSMGRTVFHHACAKGI